MGCTRAARHAGTQQAVSAATVSTATVTANVNGSPGAAGSRSRWLPGLWRFASSPHGQRRHMLRARRSVGLVGTLKSGVYKGAMRRALPALVLVTAVGAVAWVIISRPLELPQVQPTLEPLCAEAMRRRPPDHSWRLPSSEKQLGAGTAVTINIGDLAAYGGQVVRVAGVLHVEFEAIGLYPSRAAMAERRWLGPWVDLGTLWPDEPYWRTKGPLVSDRCVVVEGTYRAGAGGHFDRHNGTIANVRRLDVWSIPHRPFASAPSPAPPHPAEDP